MERRKANKSMLEVCVIILGDTDELIICNCGCKFVATSRDFRLWRNSGELLQFVECPKCTTPHVVMYDVHDGSEIVCIEEENKTTDNGNEKEKEDENYKETRC